MKPLDQHPQFVHHDEIADICRPLERLKIDYFAHINVQSQLISGISNSPEFSMHYLEKKYYNADLHMAGSDLIKDYYIWDVIGYNGQSAKMKEDAVAFGARHPFTIIQQNKDSVDYYHFATGLTNESIYQIYISNLDLLKLFILLFKEKVNQSKELRSAYDIQLNLDQQSAGFTLCSEKPILPQEGMRKSFLQEMTGKMFQFSKRELECLQLTLKGQSAKQIAHLLGISYRTVEEHLANVKLKVGADSKTELREKANMG